MTEPWSSIWPWSCLILFVASGCVLLYGAVRRRNPTLGLLCLAMVIWPITGELLNAAARHHAREAPRAGDTSLLGVWGMSPGELITKVAAGVWVVQSLLVLAASIALLRFMNRRRAVGEPIQAAK